MFKVEVGDFSKPELRMMSNIESLLIEQNSLLKEQNALLKQAFSSKEKAVVEKKKTAPKSAQKSKK